MSTNKNLELALASITKQFGEGSIVRLTDTAKPLECLPFDVIGLDNVLGCGGLPRGRIIEIFGPESSGKTTVTLTAIAQAQKAGGIAAFIDVEHALDPKYAKALGVNLNDLLVSQPDSGEEALSIMEMLIKSGSVDVVVLDSVAALITQKELEGEMGDVTMGAQARLMSQAMRKLTSFISKTNTVAFFTNQIREKIGVMFGNPETTPGGKALKFYASVRMDICRKEAIKLPDGTVIGNRTKVKVVKNKVGPPFRECEFDIIYGEGISKSASLLEMAIELGVVEKKGAWLYHDGVQLAQGMEAGKKELKTNTELFEKIKSAILSKLNFEAPILPPEEDPGEMPEEEFTAPAPAKPAAQTPAEPVATFPTDAVLPDVKPGLSAPSGEKLSFSGEITNFLELQPNKQSSISDLAVHLSVLFPDKPMDNLKNQLGVALATGATAGKYKKVDRGVYAIA